MTDLPIIQLAIADDHTLVRKGLIALLNGFGAFNVFIEADNGQDLLDKISTASYQPDICILDINMPVMNGYDTVLEIRKQWQHIKVLALSMIDCDYAVLTMLRNGAHGFVAKTTPAPALKAALIDIYTTGFHFSDAVKKRLPGITADKLLSYTPQLLTAAEIRFLSLCCSDKTYEEIGIIMHLSKRTAEKYAAAICEKINLHKRVELGLYALHTGIGVFNHT